MSRHSPRVGLPSYSNNILLMKDHRAKITDFGMSRFMQVNYQLTALTLCPGTQAYMPPESLEEPPQYTPKLDCFSFGVLAIQIITREFPAPEPRFQTISDPYYLLGVRLPVLKKKQRESHISMIEPSHTMLPIIKKCLSYNEQDRPTAVELCKSVAELKNTAVFEERKQASVQKSRVVFNSHTLAQVRGEALSFQGKEKTVSVFWKQGSILGFGGDRSQTYTLCNYTLSSGAKIPIYVQQGYNIPSTMKIDSDLQYGIQEGVMFCVYHDKSQKLYIPASILL